MTSLVTNVSEENRAEQGGLVKGVAVGIVTQNQDSLGRVKVSFPWRDHAGESNWARVAAPMAGADRGAWFNPEVGDEVLVAFERGEITQPYVLGQLWNGQDLPPTTNSDGNNDVRQIKSRLGHELIFNDGSDPFVEIRTSDGKIARLDTGKIELTDGRNKMTIDSNAGGITLESIGSITIKSTEITIEATAAMTVKAGGTLTIQGALVQIN